MDQADHCVPVNDGVHSDEGDEMSCAETPYSVKELPQASESDTLKISSTFNSYSYPGDHIPDMILISADGIRFYIHRKQLLDASDTYWSNLLISLTGVIYPSSLRVVEDSPTLNVVLHVIYRLSLKDYSPSLTTLEAAVDSLKTYGIPLKSNISPGMPLYDELVVKLPSMALEVYTIAAENDLFELACEASKHLLSLHVSSLSPETTVRIGPVYVCMLCDLLMERAYVLKRLVIQPPEQHAPTATCGTHGYHDLLLDWAKIAYNLVFGSSLDISPELLNATLRPLDLLHSCPACVQSIDRRIQDVVSIWALTPNSVCVNSRGIYTTLP